MKLKRVRQHGPFSNSFEHPWLDAEYLMTLPPRKKAPRPKKKNHIFTLKLESFTCLIRINSHQKSHQKSHQVDESKEISMTEAKPECNCFAPALFMRGDL